MRKKAFTMIELLVVMAIMAILTIITVSQFTTAKVKARDSQRKADLSSVSKALLMYYADYSKFPLVANVDLTTGGAFTDGTADPGGLYMKVMPKENTSSNPSYRYLVSEDGSKYAVLGKLENLEDKDTRTKANPDVARAINCGGTNIYNYGFVSPNISLDEELGGADCIL